MAPARWLWLLVATGCATGAGGPGPESTDVPDEVTLDAVEFPVREVTASGPPAVDAPAVDAPAVDAPAVARGGHARLQDPEAPAGQQPGAAEGGESAATPATDPESTAALGTTQQPESAESWFRGRWSTRYWLRWTDSDQKEQNIYSTLSADLFDAERDGITAHVTGRVVGDLDGRSQNLPAIVNTFDSGVVGQLFDAYVDFHDVSGLGVVRVGRQSIYDAPVVAFFDGVRLESEPIGSRELIVGAYGGLSSRIYEGQTTDDWMTGAYAELRPWSGGRARFDYLHLEDRTLFGNEENDLLGVGLWQQLAEGLQIDGEYTMLDGESRDVRSRLSYYDADADLQLQLSYYQLLETQRNLSLELDPYFAILQELFPYYQFGAMASTGLGEHFQVQSGVDIRRVDDDDDVGQFNRDYERVYANLTVADAPWDGFSLTLLGDFWMSGSRTIDTLGVDVTQEIDEDVELAAGTYYSLYKFDAFAVTEREDVRTYYVRVTHEPTENVDLELSYELEDTDIDLFHGLRLRGVWRF
ncbi:MAG: hypothetical protein IPM29_12305 [Planctomycetes bacterium]|nr:hypothetical protein [Planctomycetota bacterium]